MSIKKDWSINFKRGKHTSMSFLSVKRNISENLDSTRVHDESDIAEEPSMIAPIAAPVEEKVESKAVTSPYFTKKSLTVRQNRVEEPSISSTSTDKTEPMSPDSPPKTTVRKTRAKRKPTLLKVCDSDTESEDVTEDDDWKGESSEDASDHSDSEEDFKPATKGKRGGAKNVSAAPRAVARKPAASSTRVARGKQTKKKGDDMVLFDLTHAEVVEVDENFKPQDVSGMYFGFYGLNKFFF